MSYLTDERAAALVAQGAAKGGLHRTLVRVVATAGIREGSFADRHFAITLLAAPGVMYFIKDASMSNVAVT